MSCDAHHITAPHPEGEGARLVMENAIKSANIDIKNKRVVSNNQYLSFHNGPGPMIMKNSKT